MNPNNTLVAISRRTGIAYVTLRKRYIALGITPEFMVGNTAVLSDADALRLEQYKPVMGAPKKERK